MSNISVRYEFHPCVEMQVDEQIIYQPVSESHPNIVTWIVIKIYEDSSGEMVRAAGSEAMCYCASKDKAGQIVTALNTQVSLQGIFPEKEFDKMKTPAVGNMLHVIAGEDLEIGQSASIRAEEKGQLVLYRTDFSAGEKTDWVVTFFVEKGHKLQIPDRYEEPKVEAIKKRAAKPPKNNLK